MASLRQIRRRMKSVEGIHEITGAMEMIAGFRFRRAENRFSKARPFLIELERLVNNLAPAATQLNDPFFVDRAVVKKTLVVVTGDRGLCGAYNTNLVKAAMHWLEENRRFDPSLVPVGKKGADFFKKRNLPILSAYPEKGFAEPSLAQTINDDLKKAYLSGRTDSIELLYTGYRSAGDRNEVRPFLGLGYLAAKAPKDVDFIYEPTFEHIFKSAVSRYLEGRIYLALVESLTSEQSARMIAMKQATENGEEVLDDLSLLRNKTRQATITRELTEIVGGAAALI